MSVLTVQAATSVLLTGTVALQGAPVDLSGSTISAEIAVGGAPETVDGTVTDGPGGRFTIRLSETLTAGWQVGRFGSARLTRRVGGDVLPLGVMYLRVV